MQKKNKLLCLTKWTEQGPYLLISPPGPWGRPDCRHCCSWCKGQSLRRWRAGGSGRARAHRSVTAAYSGQDATYYPQLLQHNEELFIQYTITCQYINRFIYLYRLWLTITFVFPPLKRNSIAGIGLVIGRLILAPWAGKTLVVAFVSWDL